LPLPPPFCAGDAPSLAQRKRVGPVGPGCEGESGKAGKGMRERKQNIAV
jgi:hypothetical protein